MRSTNVRGFIGFVGFVLFISWTVAYVFGCQRAAYAERQLRYGDDLDECYAEAVDAGRLLAVYDQCAREADKRHGVTP
jgi:hypothetical protein